LITGFTMSGWLEVPLGYVDSSTYWTVTVIPLAVLFLARPEEINDRTAGR